MLGIATLLLGSKSLLSGSFFDGNFRRRPPDGRPKAGIIAVSLNFQRGAHQCDLV
jgi:hypothetical protein